MNKRLSLLISCILVASFLLTNCGPVTHVPDVTQTSTPEPLPDVQVQTDQIAPHIIEQVPPAGQRLELASGIRIVFDRDMDQDQTAEAFMFLNSDNEPVPGKVGWADPRTLSFEPDARLEPSAVYKATFSAAATGADGKALEEDLQLEFATTDALAVGQVFPIHDSEEIDPKTNITVIFNQPVVPLKIKEEQSDLPQPLAFSPEVAGQGEWVNSSVYVFQPEKPLLSGTHYTVRVERGLKDTLGDTLEKSHVWQFSTRVPVIENFYLKDSYREPMDLIENVVLDQAFIVTFLQPMDAESASENVMAINSETSQPAPLRLTWNDEFTMLTIEPAGRFQIATYYDLTISQEMRAQDGGTLKEGLTQRFGTVPLPRVNSTSPGPNGQATEFSPHLQIDFASPMNIASLKDRVKISPQPKDRVEWYFSDYSWDLNIFGLEPGTDYIVRVLPGAADIYGNVITSEYSFAFRTADMFQTARLALPWQPLVYRAKGPQEVYFEQTNSTSAIIALYSITFDQFKVLMGDGDKRLFFDPQTEPIREWEGVSEEDVRNEVNSRKFKLQDANENPLLPGYYFIGLKNDLAVTANRFQHGYVFIVATDNLTLKTSMTEASAWVVDLESGAPQKDLSVTFYDQDLRQIGKNITDQHGLAYVNQLNKPAYARVEGSDHVAFTAVNWGSGVWSGDYGFYEIYYRNPIEPFAYLYTDRPLYRPGQEVYFKGIVRRNDDLHYSLPQEEKVYVSIALNEERVFGEYMPLSKLGSFTGTFKLAPDAALGTYAIQVRKNPGANSFSSLTFRVAEYRKPEYEVLASPDRSSILAGEQVTFSLDAKYYSGGDLGSAQTEWFLEAIPYTFEPDSDDYWQFSFMDWDRDDYWEMGSSTKMLAQGKGVTDENGHLEVTETLGLDENKNSQHVSFRVNVSDVGGNVVSGGTAAIVHQSEIYAGVRSVEYIGKQGEEQPFEIVVLDRDSEPVADQDVTVRFVERRWYSVQKQDKQGQLSWESSVKEIPITQTTATTGADGKATVSFVPPAGGIYKAIVTVRDSKGHTHLAADSIWVTSDRYVSWRQTNDRTFDLVVDKDTYSPGDTAEILIAQPFEHDVYALITYERGHVYKQNVVLLEGNSTVYKLPITADMAPIAYVSVIVISGAEQGGTPDFKVGIAELSVDTDHQELEVKVTADPKSAGPGDTITYTVETKDYSGKPVSADVSLAVVDKAVLALAPPNSGRMIEAFYPWQSLGVRTALGIVLNAEDYNARYRESVPEGGGMGGGGIDTSLGIINVRGVFKDTAFFQGLAITDEAGKAEFTVTLPDNLTTWQADVRAVTADSRVGQTTGELLSTKPLFVQLQTPRFFVNGDQATVGAVIHNNEDQAMTVKVALDAKGVELLSPAGQEVDVPAGEQKFVQWDLTVQEGVKRVDLTAQAVSGVYQDATKPALGTLSDQGIPVYNYVATETVGTAGMLQEANSATEAIQLPSTMDFSNAQLSVEMSPSLAASMQSGLTYLEEYPYLCMEQTVSRFLPNVISARALKQAGRSSAGLQTHLDTNVEMALQRIYAKQNYDGGWNWWDGEKSDPQTTAYVVYGMLEAKESGYTVSEAVLANGIQYLKANAGRVLRLDKTNPAWEFNRMAFIVYVLARADDLRVSYVNSLYEYRTSLGLYGKAYLAQAMHLLDPEDARIDSLLSDLEAAAVLSAAGAHWEEGTRDYWNWNTDTRTTAIVLNAFTQLNPQSPVTANAVRWLMAHRESGHWYTTQETAWSLIALTNWMSASNEYDTEYSFAIGLNGEMLERGAATSENLTESVKLQVELEDLLKETANYLVFTRGAGTGNLYYSAYLSAELPVESIQPLDQGVSISRQYFAADDLKTPITEIQRGELVRVRLTVVVPAAVHHIVIDDPLPAGLEAVDSTILTDTAVPASYTLDDYKERGWGWWYFSHIERLDEKVVLSADTLPAGTYVYTYLARASTAGIFKVIPPTASEFYFPDVGGRGAGSEFEVKP